MMNLRKFTFILSLLIITALSATAQTDSVSLTSIVEKAAKYNSEHPIEKVYLHFDKPYYAITDTIWFKAYVTADAYQAAVMHVPSTISNVIYVDIISSKDSIVRKLKLPATNGVAFANIALISPLFRQGSYHFRAYTNWMRNSDPAYFFNKTINIGNVVEKQVFTNISLSGSAKGNTSKVDVKINFKNPEGQPYASKKLTWKIQTSDDETPGKGKATTDANGDVIINFSTNKPINFNTSLLVTSLDITEQKTVNSSFTLKNAVAPIDVQFFPEGGDLINGVKTRVAFKAINPVGLGIDVKGTITDNTGATVAELAAQHLGMGVFNLLPASGKTYKANVTFPDGSKNTYNLPAVKDNGITINVVNTDPEKVNIRVAANEQYLATHKGKQFYIVAQTGQMICYAGQTPPLVNTVFPAAIPKSKFPSGVVKLTLFATNGQALAERSIFVQRNDQLTLSLNSAKQVYSNRQQVVMNVSAKKATTPVEANLSVTVLDETKVPVDENAETTILTSLLLTSDLKGYVEKPNYYFNKPTEKTDADLDVLMLTQGYTRFVYKDILAATTLPAPPKFMPEDGISISGTLRSADGRPINRGNVTFIIKNRMEKSTLTNTIGEFKFSKLFFPDSVEATLNARGNYNANNMLILPDNDKYLPPTINTTAPDEIANIDSTMKNYLQASKLVYQNSRLLKEVVIKATTYVKQPSHQDYATLTGLSSIPNHVISGKSMIACPTMFDCLRSGGYGLTFNPQNNQLFLSRGYNQGQTDQPVAIYYNGQPVDFTYLANIKPDEVDNVEVFYNDGLSNINRMLNTNGVVSINGKVAKKQTFTKDQLKELLGPQYSGVPITPKGYTMARMFYSPVYDASKTGSMGGDLRSTIYWNPRVQTDKTTGNATFDFFTSDGKGSFRAIVEGIDVDGNIGRTIYRYKVQ